MRSLLFVLLLAAGCSGAPAGQSAAAETSSETAEAQDCPTPTPCPTLECPAADEIDPEPCEPSAETESSKGGQILSLHAATFDDLPGWASDEHAEAVSSFLRSCEILAKKKRSAAVGVPRYAGKVRDWLPACRAAKKVGADDAAGRAFFEKYFRPYAAHGSMEKDGAKAKFSGYYVQGARGSLEKSAKYQTPLMRRPKDLVETQLSDFIKDGRGRRIWGRRNKDTGKLEPYPTRKEIRKSPLHDDQVLVWLDDPIDAVFAEIQGSAVIEMDDGSTRWAAFDGKNGRRFRGVGGILRRMGELKRGQGTMAGTRAWFEKNLGRYHEIVDKNDAKVFFKWETREGAIGTQNAVLSARRSIAIDRAAIAFSTPIWVDTRAPVGPRGKNVPWQTLLIAQDTGGAILGPVRGDIYWGEGREAGAIAGRMGGPGKMWLLLPAKLKVPTK